MARQTTLPGRWIDLAHATGGIVPLAQAIGVSRMTLWRVANEKTEVRPPLRKVIDELARVHRLPSPLAPISPPQNLRSLELLGQGILKGQPVPQSSVDHLRGLWADDALVRLAEKDDVAPTVHAAVAYLLGL